MKGNLASTTTARRVVIVFVGAVALAGVLVDAVWSALSTEYNGHQVLGGFFFSIWSLIATYLVLDHIVEVKERQQWRDVAQTSLDSLSKQVLEVCEMATVATHASVQQDGSAKQGSQLPDSPLYLSLKSFDRVFEIISPVLTTTPDLGQAYLRLSKWRMAAWRFHHRLREGREDDAIENWEIAERERHEWFVWLQRDAGLAYRVLDSNASQGQP